MQGERNVEFTHKLPKLQVVDRVEFILEECEGKDILHLGAVDFYENSVCGLHRKLMEVSNDVIGIDIDEEGIETAKKENINNIYQGDVENLERSWQDKKIQIILATEIIEHLDNPGLFLESVKKFFDDETKMIITTPNSFSLHRFFYSFLTGKENVHNEHTGYYSYNTLKYLLKKHNFTIETVYYYTLGRNFEKNLYKIFPKFSTGLIFIVSL